MHKINDSLRAVNQRHPHFRLDLRRGGSGSAIEWRGLNEIPDDLFAAIALGGPGLEIIEAGWPSNLQLPVVISYWVNIITDNIARR